MGRWAEATTKLNAKPEREHRIASYNKGCRCDECRRAAREARARQRAAKKAAA